MVSIGLIGGIGPESTIDYYRLFIALYRKRRPEGGYPSLLINSINMTKMLELVEKNDLSELANYLAEEVGRLADAGATLALMASNTPHIVFDHLQNISPIPLISIVETACRAAIDRGMKRVGLFGTRFTMQGGFYQKIFQREGIELVVPDTAGQDYIHTTYMTELVNGVYRDEVRERFIALARELREQQGIEGLVLGGTELPLLMRDAEGLDISMIDTARLHVERAVTELVS
jgi:aspartate racemase